MRRLPKNARSLLSSLLLVLLLAGCQSGPTAMAELPTTSSLLALDVVFPVPIGRDPDLVQVFFVRGAIHAGQDELPELIPATFVKWSRAYLLDPEPGTYSVVAVTAAYAPPWNEHRIAGVDKTTWSGTSSDAIVFPEALIRRTRTRVGPGRVAFVGALQIRRGERIDANTVLQDELQRRIAERLRPGVASKSGFAGWLERTRRVKLEQSTLGNDVADRKAFVDEATADLADSPWAGVIARATTMDAEFAELESRPPRTKRAVVLPQAGPVTPPAADVPQAASELPAPTIAAAPVLSTESPAPAPAEATTATAEPATTAREPEAATEQTPHASPAAETAPAVLASAAVIAPEAAPPSPQPRIFPGLPKESPLAQIEYGMRHHDVQDILGPPDGRLDRQTAKAWIPFYNGPGANLRDWIYEGTGRVVFSLYRGKLEVVDVVYDPGAH